MYLERFHDELLAQTSYLIGCPRTGQALVVDPNRDADQYLRAAKRENLRIVSVTETHIHADFVSGSRDLARLSGSQLILSGDGGPEWQYAFAKPDGARLVHDGDAVHLGDIRLDVRHTPGHTPEHIVFIVTDTVTSDQPMGMLSGDFIFVGDVGRPDLLERAAQQVGTMGAMARQLFQSIQALGDLPDHLQIWPGHGAGSACGKALGAMPSTTLGYERLSNWAFQSAGEDDFVAEVLAGQPDPPKYFAIMKRVNREGPPPSRAGQEFPELDVSGLKRAIGSGATLVDVRPAASFAGGHIPGAINLPNGSSLGTWAGAVLTYDRQIVLLAENRGQASRARHGLSLMGLDRVSGWADTCVEAAWVRDGGALGVVRQESVGALAGASDRVVLDVRRSTEWDEGHLPTAQHRFLGDLVELTRDLPKDTPIAVHCQGGTRSVIAASLLQANGFSDVVNVAGGFKAWAAAGLPVVKSGG